MAPEAHLANQLHALPKSKLTAERLRPLLAACQPRVLAAAFSILDGRGAGQRAFDTFRILRSLSASDPLSVLCNTHTYATIITLTPGSARGVLTAQHLLMEMRTRGIPRNADMYSAALSVCVRADRCATALQVYDDMCCEGLEPDLVTYHTLMDAYGQLRQWRSAIAVLNTIVEKGVSAEWSYNMALVACGRAGRAAEAVDVFARMLSAGMRPSLSTYTALMSLFCRAGALREAAFVLEGMQAAGLQPNTITYSSLINGCEKAGSLPDALRYFEEMLAAGCKPSVVTFNTLLRACARARAWRLAVQLWHQMQNCGLHPDIVSVRAWITAMHASGCWPGVLLVLQQRLPRAVDKDPILQSKMCEALWSAGSCHSRSAALALPGARVNMPRVDHALCSAEGAASSIASGALVQPGGGFPSNVISSWSVSTQQPGPAVASVALWLHSLVTSYDWALHTISVASVYVPAAAAASASFTAILPSPQHSEPAYTPPLPYPNSSLLPGHPYTALSAPATAAALAASFSNRRPGTAPQHAKHAHHRRGGSGGYPDCGAGDSDTTPLLPFPPLDSTPHAATLTPPWPCYPGPVPEFGDPKYQSQMPAMPYMPRQQRALATPPDTAQILQLCLDLSQQEHIVGAVTSTLEAAIEQYQWPLRLQVQGSSLHVSCSREDLAVWLERGATVLGAPLPDPLDSQRSADAVTAFLEQWMSSEGTLRAALALETGWPEVAPPPSADWAPAAAAVAAATKAVGLPPPAVVRALQLLTHILGPPPTPAGTPGASGAAVAPEDMPAVMVSLSAMKLDSPSTAAATLHETALTHDHLAGAAHTTSPSASNSTSATAGICGPFRPFAAGGSNGSSDIPQPEDVPVSDGLGLLRRNVMAARNSGMAGIRGGAAVEAGAGSGSGGTMPSSSSSGVSSSGPMCPPPGGCSVGFVASASLPGGGSGSGGAGGGSRREDEGACGDPNRSHVITSVCVAHAAAAAEKLVYDLRLPPEVVHPGVAVQGNVTLPPSIWQYFDLFLTLTDPQPSAARSAVLRFREVHLVTIACEPSLHRFPPSLTAAAAFTCVRRCMRIAPEWPQVLIGVTGHVLVPAPHNRSGGGGGGDEARDTTALGMACELVAETLRLPPFTPSAYQNVLAEGLDGMLRMDQRQHTTESSVAIEELRRVLLRACFVLAPGCQSEASG